MSGRELIRKLPHSEEFGEPRAGRNVYPNQFCAAFQERGCINPAVPKCWFCRYAYFGLESERALEVGICRYPEVQTR